MTLTIPDSIAQQAGIDEPSAMKELALLFFSQKRISASQARRLAGVNLFVFESWLRERQLPVHEFTEAELDADLQTLQSSHLL